MSTLFGPTALLSGILWGLRGWVGLSDPRYWAPVTGTDFAAVFLFSGALLSLAACVSWLRLGHDSLVRVGGAVAATGLFAAGIANLLEDAAGLRGFGLAYVTSVVVGTLALVPLGAGLLRAPDTRWLGGLVLLTVPALMAMTTWPGTAVLTVSWVAAGIAVMRSRPRGITAG